MHSTHPFSSDFETEEGMIDAELQDILEITEFLITIAAECLAGLVPIAVDHNVLANICRGIIKSNICTDLAFLSKFRQEMVSSIKNYEI